jgi:hypothetical protein
MFFDTVSYEHNRKYWLAILALKKCGKNLKTFPGYFTARTNPCFEIFFEKLEHFEPTNLLFKNLKKIQVFPTKISQKIL